MEEVKVSFHKHPLRSFTRFALGQCKVCEYPHRGSIDRRLFGREHGYIYGGYRCNEQGCDDAVFHKDCAKPLQEINHSSHPDHPLKFIQHSISWCDLCSAQFKAGYRCSICDFRLDLWCAKRPSPLVIPENPYGHEHQLELKLKRTFTLAHKHPPELARCKACSYAVLDGQQCYGCNQCEFFIHLVCVHLSHTTYHPQHPLKFIGSEAAPDYADEKCLLCASTFIRPPRLHHCDVCNVSICDKCVTNPPPVSVVSPTTHEHRLHLVPRCIAFTCNACGTLGDRRPYFCLACNFMIHRECIDLPRVININRHDHRISYTPRLGHGDWKCGVCRKKVDGFYGAYACSRCPSYVVHSICATRRDVWDMVELEGTPEEEIVEPFEVIDGNTIKHFSHDHNLGINKDVQILLHESIVCEACVFQIGSEPFYSCEQCDFFLHRKCANLPRKTRHVCHNQPFTLRIDSHRKVSRCILCRQDFTGFRYETSSHRILDVRCGSISEPYVHKSHQHPLYYSSYGFSAYYVLYEDIGKFCCDECDFTVYYDYAALPEKVMRHRYDDHPLCLCYGESSVDGEYWCEACETKVNPKKWFYTCNDCGVVLHISCVVGDLSYCMPVTSYGDDVDSVTSSGEEVRKMVLSTSMCRALVASFGDDVTSWCDEVEEVDPATSSGEDSEKVVSNTSICTDVDSVTGSGEDGEKVVSNTSVCRAVCSECNSRCMLPSILKVSKAGVVVYFCSFHCYKQSRKTATTSESTSESD
ncbi:unnamed protein product [Thlaspi arvense]|uniref:Phorbol-ester/DAG-type domain-containing protein n=1 Tax=Thlaspi arvense TaxID=13288 RepID=A0AAU9RYS6_THLAR|nr:unnamed protein product [Thlaspi arvense]